MFYFFFVIKYTILTVSLHITHDTKTMNAILKYSINKQHNGKKKILTFMYENNVTERMNQLSNLEVRYHSILHTSKVLQTHIPVLSKHPVKTSCSVM